MFQDDLTVRLQSARQLLAAGSFAEAHTALTQLRRDYPRSPDVLVALAVVLANSGNLSEAIECLNGAVASQPNARTYYNLAMVLRRKGDDDQAMLALERALELDPNYERARQMLYQISGSGLTSPAQPPAAC